jgi:hypothetical protein
MVRKSRLLLVAFAALVATAIVALPALAAPLPGAIFTTNVGCDGTNINIYTDKGHVYLDGGPTRLGAAGLPDGSYYVQVTDPSGATVLGQSLGADVSVSGGEFLECYQLSDILYSATSGFTAKGYDDTPNGGGEYKVWVSTVSTFINDSTKTDNFKVKAEVNNPAKLTVNKFYDANADGINNTGDQAIPGWQMKIQDGMTLIKYTPIDVFVDPDTYTVTESTPLESNWKSTTPNPVTGVQVGPGETKSVEFGNVCVGAGGGLTLGFWFNPNGQKLITSVDLQALRDLSLRNKNGSNFDPTTNTQVKNWLISADATNMAYMLSAQLAAMKLNVLHGFVNGNQLIYAPGAQSANSLGYATVNAVMAEANTSLGANSNTTATGASRTYQEALKNALDNANNNKNFVQSSPCPFTFAQ